MSDNCPVWSRAFDDLIELPDGRELRTLADAGHYATALAEDVQQRTEWRIAAEMLIAAADHVRRHRRAHGAERR